MTVKLQTIPSLSKVLSPMKAVEGGFVPDFQSRYFTEDFPFGLALIRRLAHEHEVRTPVIDRICEWGLSYVN